jgi:hypothetical protein
MSTAISILGGVGLFLLGMTVMTSGLKALAGSGLRTVLSKAAGTPLSGAFWGAVVTLLVQSSSATTMTTIGLVSAGLLTFPLIDVGGTGCRALLCKLHGEAAGCRLNPNCARSCGRSRRFLPAPERAANDWRRRRRWNGCGRVSPNSVIRMLRSRCNSRCPTGGRAIYFSRYAGVTG